jgi:hypothetical protein
VITVVWNCVEFATYAKGVNSPTPWMATCVPLMHEASCIDAKRNVNCLGCSECWKSVKVRLFNVCVYVFASSFVVCGTCEMRDPKRCS